MPEKSVDKFTSKTGRRIYRITVETFPGHKNNVYLIAQDIRPVLLDSGSGMEFSTKGIEAGIDEVRTRFGEKVSLDSLREVIITHGHIDHFGGLMWLKKVSKARVLVHELDSRILANFAERLIVASKDLGVFLRRAGIGDANRRRLQDAYMGSKDFFSSVPVQKSIKDGESVGDGLTAIHTPGHCPGHICLLMDDILFTGDHILPRITPHQSPQSITPYCGLKHYLDSLDKTKAIPGVRLGLPAHGRPIEDVYTRIEDIKTFHQGRLAKVLEICRDPKSISQISLELFGEVRGYHIMLALEETGAHVEYLYEHGKLSIANLDEVKREENPILYYRSL